MRKVSLLVSIFLSCNFLLLSAVTTKKYTVHLKKKNVSVQHFDEKQIKIIQEQENAALAFRDRQENLYRRAKAVSMKENEENSEANAVSLSAFEETFNYKENYSGKLVFLGTFINNGSSSAVFVSVAAEVYNSGGTKLGEGFTYAYGGKNVKLTASGVYTNAFFNEDIGYFKVFTDASFDQADTLDYTITYSTFSNTLANAAVSITDGPYSSSGLAGLLKLEGDLTNSSTTYLTYFTMVYFCIFDSNDVVQDTFFTFVDGSTYKWGSGNDDTTDTALYPGETGTFDILSAYAKYSEASTFLASFTFDEKLYSSGSKPTIALSRTKLNFGASGGNKTDSQTFMVSNTGSGTLYWSASDNASWLNVSPSSGTNTGVVTVSVDTGYLAPGTYNGVITISDSNATNNPQTVNVLLKVYSQGISTGPFGEFSTPISGTTVSSSIPVTGWVLDDIGVQNVKIYRDDNGNHIYIGDAIFVEGARPDVAAAYPDYPQNYLSGWGYMLLTNFLPNKGNGTFTLYAKATDKEGNTVSLGSKTITCDNAHAVKPFGAIDTPAQGGTASGTSFRNWGWVLTPQPNFINTNGSTINVYVDGVSKGHAYYNVYRSDIANFFPGYANSNGAVGYLDFDTTGYSNGIHTIGWVATDSGSNADGIGSRFFSIQNTSSMSGSNAAGPGLQVNPIDPVNLEKIPLSLESVEVLKGYNDNAEGILHYAGEDGSIHVEIEELERVVIRLFTPSNHGNAVNRSIVNTSPLPIGSTLDPKEGIFYWMPGAGFVGEYRFDFVEQWDDGTQTGKIVLIKIAPRFPVQNDDKTKSKL